MLSRQPVMFDTISILTATRAVTAKLPKFLFLKSTSFAQFVHSRIAHTQNFTIYPSNLFFTSHFRSYLQCESNRYVMLTYSSHNCISVSLLLSSKQWYIVLHMLKLFLDTIKTFYYISFFHINDNEKHSRYTQISKDISATSICYFEYHDIIFYRDKNYKYLEACLLHSFLRKQILLFKPSSDMSENQRLFHFDPFFHAYMFHFRLVLVSQIIKPQAVHLFVDNINQF